jgi:beta-mannanase
MNGDWQTFQPTASGDRAHAGTYAEFVAAWRHVVGYTRAAGATNLKWVFNPTADTYTGTTPVSAIWPGREYVDVLGLDGFNWGRDSRWGRWRSFKNIFATQYQRLTALHPTAPVWICEFGSKEPKVRDGAPADPTRSKADWLRQALTTRAFPRVRMLIYFHADKERDWRVNSSRSALRTVRRILRRS